MSCPMNEEHLYSLFLCVLFFLDTQPGQNTNSYYWSSFVEVCCEPPHHPTIYTYINICRSVPKPTHPSSVVDRATEWVQCGAGPFPEPCFGLMIGEVNASGDGRKDYQMDKPNQPPQVYHWVQLARKWLSCSVVYLQNIVAEIGRDLAGK